MSSNSNAVPFFSDIQIENQFKKQVEFLKLVHPFLSDVNTYHKECVELRAIPRTSKIPKIKSLNLWRIDNKAEEESIKFLNKINGYPYCIYYSVFAFNYDLELTKKDGTQYVKGKINNKNALYTTTLVMDFDNVSAEDHEKYINKFKELDIEVCTVYTGHGFQDLILLSEKVYDNEILKKFTSTLLAKGFEIDSTIIDAARVMRLPFTFNCKEYENNFDDGNSIPCKLISTTNKRYSVLNIFDRLYTLPTINEEIQEYIFDLKDIESVGINDSNDVNSKDINNSFKIISIYDQYKLIKFDMLPKAVQNMLINTPDGLRNSTLLFLVGFLKNYLKLSMVKIKAILKIWANHCSPNLDEEFVENEVERLYKYEYKGYGKYTSDLAKHFGYLEFDVYKLNNKVIIPNELFEDYTVLSDGSVRIYLMMKVFEIVDNIKVWNNSDIAKAADISIKSVQRNLEVLINLGYIDKRRGYKKSGEKYTYCINSFYNKTKGFTMFETGTLENMVYNRNRSLTDGELKLYTYIRYMIGQSDRECYASQEYLGKKINKTRDSVCKMTTFLRDKGYINKDSYISNNKPHCLYVLNY